MTTTTTQTKGGVVIGLMVVSLAAYQFLYLATKGGHATSAWPVFAIYIAALALAVLAGPQAVTRAIETGLASRRFSLACISAALAGLGMSLAIGDQGLGGEYIFFYWFGLAVLWSGSIVMIHICERASKALAVRDWTVYAYAMALLPLTIVPGNYIWPLFFDLSADQTLITAATMSFAAHFLAAHFVIFEILERRPPK